MGKFSQILQGTYCVPMYLSHPIKSVFFPFLKENQTHLKWHREIWQIILNFDLLVIIGSSKSHDNLVPTQ